MITLIAAAFVCLQKPQLTSEFPIYTPEKPVSAQNISLQPWGAGSFTESDWVVLSGKHSLRLTSNNYFQGGVMSFKKPLDMTKWIANPHQLLRFTFFLESRGKYNGKTAISPTVPGNIKTNRFDPNVIPATSHVNQMRLVLTTSDGKKSEFYLPVGIAKAAVAHGWRTAAIPIRAFRGIGKTNKSVTNILFTMNTFGIAYLGQMDIATDPVPITAEVDPPYAQVKEGNSLRMTAQGDAGLTPLKYLWDFDEADGIQVDADTQTVRPKFNRTGSYTVTVTVVDRFGIKKPAHKKVKIRVVK